MVAAENFQEFRIHPDVTLRLARFWAIDTRWSRCGSRLRSIGTRSRAAYRFRCDAGRPRAEKEDLELFGLVGGKLLSRAFEKVHHVEAGAVVGHVHPLDFHAAEGDRFGDFDEVTDPGNGFGAEEGAARPMAARRNPGALFLEGIRLPSWMKSIRQTSISWALSVRSLMASTFAPRGPFHCWSLRGCRRRSCAALRVALKRLGEKRLFSGTASMYSPDRHVDLLLLLGRFSPAENFVPTERADILIELASQNGCLFLVRGSEIDPPAAVPMLDVY